MTTLLKTLSYIISVVITGAIVLLIISVLYPANAIQMFDYFGGWFGK